MEEKHKKDVKKITTENHFNQWYPIDNIPNICAYQSIIIINKAEI